jgi:hypothetical protein
MNVAEQDCAGSDQRPKSVDLGDIVYQGEPRTRPLYIHFRFGAYRASVHVFLYTDIGKDRLDNPQRPLQTMLGGSYPI